MTSKLIITPKKLKGDDGYRIFSIRIKESTIQQIEKLPLETGRSKNELIGLLLDFAIANCVVEKNDRIDSENQESLI